MNQLNYFEKQILIGHLRFYYHFNFRNNRITAEGAVYLAKGLMVNTCLQVLKVGLQNFHMVWF